MQKLVEVLGRLRDRVCSDVCSQQHVAECIDATAILNNMTVLQCCQVTDQWFDGPHPNDLHAVGLTMDPVRRVVEVPVGGYIGLGHAFECRRYHAEDESCGRQDHAFCTRDGCGQRRSDAIHAIYRASS